jgi:hypothetical protein
VILGCVDANWSQLQKYDSFKVWTDFDDTQKESLLKRGKLILIPPSFFLIEPFQWVSNHTEQVYL